MWHRRDTSLCQIINESTYFPVSSLTIIYTFSMSKGFHLFHRTLVFYRIDYNNSSRQDASCLSSSVFCYLLQQPFSIMAPSSKWMDVNNIIGTVRRGVWFIIFQRKTDRDRRQGKKKRRRRNRPISEQAHFRSGA